MHSTIFFEIGFAVFVIYSNSFGLGFTNQSEIIDPAAAVLGNFTTQAFQDQLSNRTDWDTWEIAPEVIKINYYRVGLDEDGSVVYCLEFGKADFAAIAEQNETALREFWKHHEQFLRRIEADSELNDKQGIVLIFDFDRFGLRTFSSRKGIELALNTMKSLVRINKAVDHGYAVHVNFLVESFLNIARPFLGDILTKFELYGTKAEFWKPKLIQNIPRDQLPEKFGGIKDWKEMPCQVFPPSM